MELPLNALRDHYPFGHVSLSEKENIIRTDRGLKRVCFWTDQRLFDWHIRFRKRLADEGVPVNRMFVTTGGSPGLFFNGGILSVHDVLEEPAALVGYEPMWSRAVAAILKVAETPVRAPLLPINAKDAFEDFSVILKQAKDQEGEVKLLKKCERDALKQHKLAVGLKRRSVSSMPFLPRLDLSDFKSFYRLLFWDVPQTEPQAGWKALAGFCRSWHQTAGAASLFKLLDDVDRHYPLRGTVIDHVFAEVVDPVEWTEAIQDLHRGGRFDKDRFIQRWDNRSRLAALIDEWIGSTGEGVGRDEA
ncbi:hypothetical protein ACFO4N_05370 [Camelliibacillus cellulosilyticus]|uniref:Uncharacterized protein n=1 Tax=Camelliibacillus cellulosilyticus TaxID=2174486 RepID=A0ABV9GIM6_9BACL